MKQFLRSILTGFLFLTLFGGAACAAHYHGHAQARVVVIGAGHVHTVHCGHYLHHGRWYVVRGHIHGRGCGHVHLNGTWVLR